VQPPLGKLLIGSAEKLCGRTDSAGYRLGPLIAGILLAPAAGWLAFRATGRIRGLLLAGALVALEHLSIVQSRICTPDAFTALFTTLSIGFSVGANPSGFSRLVCMAAFAGLTAGLACATKLSALPLVAAAFFGRILLYLAGANLGTDQPRAVLRVAAAAVAITVFVGSSAIGYGGAWFVWCKATGLPLRKVPLLHKEMNEYHRGVHWYDENGKPTHPYQSPWWSWFVVDKPVLYDAKDEFEGTVQKSISRIYAGGNPVLFLSLAPSILLTLVLGPGRLRIAVVAWVVVPILAYGAFWSYVDRPTFFYHALPEVPLFALAAAIAAEALHGFAQTQRRFLGMTVAWWIVGAFFTATAAVAALLLPLANATPLPPSSWLREFFPESWSA
jgi:dolichyl-phosphate-mannose--protein O-mannosyl transferase